MLIDTHAHLETFEDISQVIQRAAAAGVEKIVCISSDSRSSEKSVGIASDFPMVFAAVGIHPHEASSFSGESFSIIENLARNEKVVALGETGLDYHYMHSPPEVQAHSFREHIRLAKKLGLPVVVHVRDAYDDALRILREENAERAVIHCFTGDYETAKKFITEGFYISFSGIITFKNAEDIRQAAAKIPVERMLIETDSPYLAPVPFRGKKNEPAYVRQVAEKIAGLRGITIEEIGEITTKNANSFFGFDGFK